MRPLVLADQQRLWRWLHIALWDPPPAPLRPIEVLQHPGVRIYAEGWGRAGDMGVVGLDGESPGEAEPVGACWMRLVPGGQGLAWVDDRTPQLGIALEPAFQRRGLGELLMRGALAAAADQSVSRVSLTVHPENPAIRLYERCGFVKQGLRGTYHLMIAQVGR